MRIRWTLAALLFVAGCTRPALHTTGDDGAVGDDGGTPPDLLVTGDGGGACGECAAGATETMSCGSSVGACKAGTQTRTCSAACSWGSWSSCTGAVGPSPETCGDGVDNDCNGVADEGCSCAPVGAGHGSSIALPGDIVKMVSDPKLCFIYALQVGTNPRLLVLDTANKDLLTAIDLPGAADLDVSPNGKYLVVSQPSLPAFSVIDKGLWTVANVPLVNPPQRIEVSDGGVVYYVSYDPTKNDYAETHRIDLAVGPDTKINNWIDYQPDIELSADGKFLYTGGTALLPNVTRYDVSSGMEVTVDSGGWDHGHGFDNPDQWTYLSPNGEHLYYAAYQLDAHNLPFVTGYTSGRVFAEDAAGTFFIADGGVFDAQLVTRVGTFPFYLIAAALTAGDREVWLVHDGRAYYQNVDDFLAGVALGVRARAPAPLGSYAITRVVADPVRPRVYGLDGAHQRVVAIDTTTGLATGAIIVGSQPSDLTVSASGGTLWVGHEAALELGKIDLASWQFSGFVQVPIDSVDVEALGNAQVAAINLQGDSPTLVDAATGAVTASAQLLLTGGALAATADGKSLFLGESGTTSGNVFRYDVSSGTLVQTARSNPNGLTGFPNPARSVPCAADGSFVFYGGYSVEGTGLATLNYTQADTILTVTPDGRLAISETKVYRASDGKLVGSLAVTGASQAASADSKTLYIVSGGTLHTIDLTQY